MKKKLGLISMIFFVFLMLYSIVNIVFWFNDNRKTKKEIEKLQELVDDNNDIDISSNIEKDDENYLYKDFSKLESINSEFVGWIKVDGTNIDYPYVKHSDNSYYLNHSFYKNKNSAGWVYLDYRNQMDFSDTNTILYAHGRVDGTMFGSLKNCLKKSWYENDNFIYIDTKNGSYKFSVFSVYNIETTDDYLAINFMEDSFYSFVNKIEKRSVYDFDVDLEYGDKIITLSTCYNEEEKIVVHGKLVN